MKCESLISVIIPVYNRPEMLLRAVSSVLSQEGVKFELVVVDDGSTVDLTEIEGLVKKAGQKWIRTDHRGVAAARNSGVHASCGKYLAFLDSDDYWLPNKLFSQCKYHAEHSEFRISQCRERWIRNGKRVNQKNRHIVPAGDMFEACLQLCCISPSSVFCERALFEDSGGFDETFKVCEDYELWLRISLFHMVGVLEEELVVKYGGHKDQLSRSMDVMDRFRIYAILKLLMENTLDGPKVEKSLEVLRAKSLILVNGAKKRGNLKAVEYFEEVSGIKGQEEVPIYLEGIKPYLEDSTFFKSELPLCDEQKALCL